MGIEDPKWGKSSDDRPEEKDDNVNGGSKPPPRRPSRGGGDEPPDLEEVWRDFNKKLGSLFGGPRKPRGNGNWNTKPEGPPGGIPRIQFDKKFAVEGRATITSAHLERLI